MSENPVKISPPWFSFYRKIDAMFSPDPEITVEYDDKTKHLKLLVDNKEKAEALSKLLPTQRDFGGVTVRIGVYPYNHAVAATDPYLLDAAFKGNPVLSYIYRNEPTALIPTQYTFVVFKKDVVQYFDDDFSSPHGTHSTLYQEIAKEIFDDCPAMFSTDNGDGKFDAEG